MYLKLNITNAAITQQTTPLHSFKFQAVNNGTAVDLGVPLASASLDGKSTYLYCELASLPANGVTVQLVCFTSQSSSYVAANTVISFVQPQENTGGILTTIIDADPRVFGVSNVANKPMLTGEFVGKAITGVMKLVDRYYPELQEGEWLFTEGPQAQNKGMPLLVELPICTTAAEVTAAKAGSVSMADVFNRWQRYSHRASDYPSNEAVPSELNAWTYTAATDTINCTINSESVIGFISPDAYSNYDFDVMVKSTNGDDDCIGLVLAANYVEGKLWTLAARRTGGGAGHPWSIIFGESYAQSATYFAPNKAAVNWQNGGFGSTAAEAGYVSNTSGIGWSTHPNGARIQAKRRGNIIEAVTSNFNSNVLVEASKITIDLTSDPRFTPLLDKARYGFMSLSQHDSQYKVQTFKDLDATIIDMVTKTVWYQNASGAWVNTGDRGSFNSLQVERFYRSTLTGKLFFMTSARELIKLN